MVTEIKILGLFHSTPYVRSVFFIIISQHFDIEVCLGIEVSSFHRSHLCHCEVIILRRSFDAVEHKMCAVAEGNSKCSFSKALIPLLKFSES